VGFKKEQKIIMDLLVKNEETMSKLYKLCAKKFPDLRDFWLGLASDELEHADSIHRLSLHIKKGTVCLSADRFMGQDIQIVLDSVKDAMAQIKKQRITLIDALSIGLYIERSLMERRFFEVFTTVHEELKQTLLDLEKSVDEHRAKLEKKLVEKKQAQS
jgi:rubrerythrin